MTPAQMQELKNFIEARSQAYAPWVHRQLRTDLSAVVKAYALDIKNYERQTDAADAQRAAAAVWATAPDNFQQKPAPDPEPEPDPGTGALPPAPGPRADADRRHHTGRRSGRQRERACGLRAAAQAESGSDPEPNPTPQQ